MLRRRAGSKDRRRVKGRPYAQATLVHALLCHSVDKVAPLACRIWPCVSFRPGEIFQAQQCSTPTCLRFKANLLTHLLTLGSRHRRLRLHWHLGASPLLQWSRWARRADRQRLSYRLSRSWSATARRLCPKPALMRRTPGRYLDAGFKVKTTVRSAAKVCPQSSAYVAMRMF